MVPEGKVSESPPESREVATLAGGCFWCLEAVFESLSGVEKVVSGYTGGTVPRPTYEQVCSGTTGHAEAVQITFNARAISFEEILNMFFALHDPTTWNRQGADVGSQYRSAIFFHSPDQKAVAERVMKAVAASGLWENPLVTELTPFSEFFPAEGYHQGYYRSNPAQPYCRMVIAPKVMKFRQEYAAKLRR